MARRCCGPPILAIFVATHAAHFYDEPMRWTAWVIVFTCCALASAAEPHLREFSSKHYHFHTNLPADLTDDLARRMDGMYGEYAKLLKEFDAPKDADALPVYLFATQQEYAQFTSAPRNSSGIFVMRRGGRGFLASFLDAQGRDGLRRTLQHEAFHQFAYLAIGENIPVWLNEGIAQIFEEAIWTGDEFKLGQVSPRRVLQLQHDLNDRTTPDLKTFTTITPRQWSAVVDRDADKAATYYSQAWALAQFLIQNGNDDDRQRVIGLLKHLRASDAPADAWAASFPDAVALQRRFTAWASRLRPSPGATLIQRQQFLADMLQDLKGSGKTFTSMATFREYVVSNRIQNNYHMGRIRWSSGDNPAINFCDADGKPFSAAALTLEPSPTAPLPDIVCRPTADTTIRTRFYDNGHGKIEHEVVFEVEAPQQK
jgi:hypothetical protein